MEKKQIRKFRIHPEIKLNELFEYCDTANGQRLCFVEDGTLIFCQAFNELLASIEGILSRMRLESGTPEDGTINTDEWVDHAHYEALKTNEYKVRMALTPVYDECFGPPNEIAAREKKIVEA